MASDYYSVEMVCNQALRAAGVDFTIGSIQEGTKPAQECLLHYYDTMKQLLRAAHWSFARKDAPLQLVAAAGGFATDSAGNTIVVNSLVPSGFLYSYNYPTDCLLVRYVPANSWNVNPPIPTGNIVPSDNTAPPIAGLTSPIGNSRPVPTRFLITNDPNYVPPGTSNDTPGISPIGQTLILSNVQNARSIYTFEASWINLWDDLFRNAMVASLATQLAMPLASDKKFGMTMRKDNIAIAMERIKTARASSANEGVSSSDLSVDWIRMRNSGSPTGYWGGGGSWGGGPGYLYGGFGQMWFENASAY
jgi:hypothetical protein